MIWWTGLNPLESEFPFPGSLISTFLGPCSRALRVGPNRRFQISGFVGARGEFASVRQIKNGSSQGQNLAVTVSCVPTSLDSPERRLKSDQTFFKIL